MTFTPQTTPWGRERGGAEPSTIQPMAFYHPKTNADPKGKLLELEKVTPMNNSKKPPWFLRRTFGETNTSPVTTKIFAAWIFGGSWYWKKLRIWKNGWLSVGWLQVIGSKSLKSWVFHQTTITIKAKTPANQYVDLNKICQVWFVAKKCQDFSWGDKSASLSNCLNES